jgi:LPXTG-motif cell wall-anchored protein
MAKRRAVAGLGAMAAAVILLISGPAGAQTDDEVDPVEVVSPPEVAPTVLEPAAPQPPTQVEGVVQTQPLPRTGGDFGPEVLAGLALTGAGVALAVGARRRRKSSIAAA